MSIKFTQRHIHAHSATQWWKQRASRPFWTQSSSKDKKINRMKIRKDKNQSIHDVERYDDARPYSIEASKKKKMYKIKSQ